MANRERPKGSPTQAGQPALPKRGPDDSPDNAAGKPPSPLSPAELKLRATLSSSPAFRAFSASAAALPDIAAPSLEGLRVEAPAPELVTSVALEERLVSDLRSLLMRPRVAGQKALAADLVAIDVMAFSSGRFVPFSAGEAIALDGRERPLYRGLRAKLTSRESGSNVRLEQPLPSDYAIKELRGRPTVFAVSMRAWELPEVDLSSREQLASLGLGARPEEVFGAMAQRIQDERIAACQRRAQALAMEALLARARPDVSESLVDRQVGQLWSQSEGRVLKSANVPAEDCDGSLAAWLESAVVRQVAREQLGSAQVLLALARELGVIVAPEQLEIAMAEAAREAGSSLPIIAEAGKGPAYSAESALVLMTALFKQTIAQVMSQVEVVEAGNSKVGP